MINEILPWATLAAQLYLAWKQTEISKEVKNAFKLGTNSQITGIVGNTTEGSISGNTITK